MADDEYEGHLEQYGKAAEALEKCTDRYNELQQAFSDASGELIELNGKTATVRSKLARAKASVDATAESRAAEAAGKTLDWDVVSKIENADAAYAAAQKHSLEHASAIHRLRNETRVLETRVDHAGREMELAQAKLDAVRELVQAHDNTPAGVSAKSEFIGGASLLSAGDVRTEDMWTERPSVLGSVIGKIPVCPNVEEHGLDGM